MVIGKGINMTLSGLLVAATTPYPDLLAPATRVLPPLIADSLVLTYAESYATKVRLGLVSGADTRSVPPGDRSFQLTTEPSVHQ